MVNRKGVYQNKLKAFNLRFLFYIIAGIVGVGICFLLFSGGFFATGNAISNIIDGLEEYFEISALSGTYVTRHFSSSEYTPGTPLTVTINITISPNDEIINYGIEEYVPSGWSIDYVSSSDFYGVSGQRISWVVNSSSSTDYLMSREFSYTLTPPSSDSGTKIFTNNAIFTSLSSGNPVSESVSVGGSTSIVQLSTSNNPGTGNSGGNGGSSGNSRPPKVDNSTTNATIVNSLGGESVVSDTNEGDNIGNDNNDLELPNDDEKSPSPIYIVLIVLVVLILLVVIVITLIIKNRKFKETSLYLVSKSI